MKVIGYCRVSTDNQKERDTISIQEEALREYATAAGLELGEIFRDEGVSGGLEIRPGLSELLDCLDHAPEIRGVLIWKLDRLARDIVIQEKFIRDLEARGIKVISTKEDFDGMDKGTRELIRGVIGLVSQYEKWIITLRLSSGRLRKAREGGYAGGSPALGYKPQRGEDEKYSKLKVIRAEGETIRGIFALREDGATLQAIADRLNAEGTPTKRGGKWHGRTVKYILDNPVYRGLIRYAGIEGPGDHRALIPA